MAARLVKHRERKQDRSEVSELGDTHTHRLHVGVRLWSFTDTFRTPIRFRAVQRHKPARPEAITLPAQHGGGHPRRAEHSHPLPAFGVVGAGPAPDRASGWHGPSPSTPARSSLPPAAPAAPRSAAHPRGSTTPRGVTLHRAGPLRSLSLGTARPGAQRQDRHRCCPTERGSGRGDAQAALHGGPSAEGRPGEIRPCPQGEGGMHRRSPLRGPWRVSERGPPPSRRFPRGRTRPPPALPRQAAAPAPTPRRALQIPAAPARRLCEPQRGGAPRHAGSCSAPPPPPHHVSWLLNFFVTTLPSSRPRRSAIFWDRSWCELPLKILMLGMAAAAAPSSFSSPLRLAPRPAAPRGSTRLLRGDAARWARATPTRTYSAILPLPASRAVPL